MGRYKIFEVVPAKEVSGIIGCFDNTVGIQQKSITGFKVKLNILISGIFKLA